MALALFRQEDITSKKIPENIYKIDNLIPTEERVIQVYIIGLRNIKGQDKKILSKGQA